MKMKVWVLLLVLSSVLCVSADGLYEMNSVSGCSDTDGEDVLILDDEVVWYADFNKKEGVDSLPAFADHPHWQEGMYEEAVVNQQICKQNLKVARSAMKDFPKERDAPSSVAIYTTLNVEMGVQNTLICHVTGFYPAPVNFTWTKNTKKVVEGTSITVPLSNKDGTFTQTSKLDFVPKLGDLYACRVEHVSLTQPLTKIYDVEVDERIEPILGPAIFCGVGLTVGVLGVAAGIYLFIRENFFLVTDDTAGHVTMSSGFLGCAQSDCQSLSGELNMDSSFLCFSLFLIILCRADGYEYYTSSRCLFNSTELRDIDYIRSYYYNMIEYVRFDSSVGKFVGYTEYGVREADQWNKDQGQLAAMRAQKEIYCKQNVDLWYPSVLTKSVKPSVRLRCQSPPVDHRPAMFACSVYNFYPKDIKVSWLRNGQEVTSDITTTEELPDADWFYQVHSYLEYTPRSGEKISCMVEHSSLEEPLVTDWVPSMPESKKLMIVGAFGLILGLLFLLAGVIYTRMCSRDGYTPLAHKFSEKQPGDWNKDAAALSLWRPQKEKFFKSVMPLIGVHAMAPPGGHHPAMLLYKVYDFYPKKVASAKAIAAADLLEKTLPDELEPRTDAGSQ